jgi:hypothetical protein
MQQYNVRAPLERTIVDIAGPFPESKSGNQHLLIAMDYFTKWPEVSAIPNQEAMTVVDALVTNFFCPLRVLRELQSHKVRLDS